MSGHGLMLAFGMIGIVAGAFALPWRGAANVHSLYIRRIAGMMLLAAGLSLTAFAIQLTRAL